jgi:hypothetical protein
VCLKEANTSRKKLLPRPTSLEKPRFPGVAIYARCSTANNGQDPTLQTRELKGYCERRGWKIAGEYVDVGISGTKEKRPELDR